MSIKVKNKVYFCLISENIKRGQRAINIFVIEKKSLVPIVVGQVNFSPASTQGIDSEVWHYLIKEGLEKAPRGYKKSHYYDRSKTNYDIRECIVNLNIV